MTAMAGKFGKDISIGAANVLMDARYSLLDVTGHADHMIRLASPASTAAMFSNVT